MIFSFVSFIFVYFVFSLDLAKSLPLLNVGLTGNKFFYLLFASGFGTIQSQR
jgi:hypothetical protein